MNFTEILYSLAGGHELFESFIKEPLRNYIDNNAVLVAADGSVRKAEELVSIKEEVGELVSDKDFEALYPGKKIIHDNCKPYSFSKIETVPKDIYDFMTSPKGDELLNRKASLQEAGWFSKMYSMFAETYTRNYFQKHYSWYNKEHDNFWNKMHDFYKPIILTEDFRLAKISECFINSKRLKIPEHIKDKIKIVHPEVAKDDKFAEFKKKLNEERYSYNSPRIKAIRDLTEEDIKNILKEQEAFELDEEKWLSLPEDKKIEKINHLKELWSSKYLSLEPYHFITFKSKAGEWEKPEDLVFAEEYNSEQNLELLSKKGLVDLPLKFLSPGFIEGSNDDEVRKWRNFFEQLGVDKQVEDKDAKKKIVQRIGILTALKFEKERKRTARELGESEKPGYDIESKSEDNEERCIEVKGTSDSSYDILLSVNEFRGLRTKQDKYFVYVVIDTFRNPVLYVTRGDRLLDISDTKIIIPFNQWRDKAKDEEYQP